jgi:hypothetical protein
MTYAVGATAALLLLLGACAGHGETLTCSTWQGVRTCQDAHGYVSHETEWQGRTYGSDNQGGDWSTYRWRDQDITTFRHR